MRFVRFDGGLTGLVIGVKRLQVLDVAASIEQLRLKDRVASEVIASVLSKDGSGSWVKMIGAWDGVRGAFQDLVGLAESGTDAGLSVRPFEDVRIEAPIASTETKIFAIGSNTIVHIKRAMKAMLNLDLTEDDARKPKIEGLPPFGFMVWPSTVVGTGAEIAPPRGTLKFDYEGECAVYVKTGGRYLESVELWGYSAFNDLGVRDSHLKLTKEAPHGPFSLNTPKNFETGKACGPWVVVDEGPNLDTLRCVLTVNGEARQDWCLSDMIYGFNETLAFLSQSLILRPGDMLASGTGAGVAIEGGPAGPHWLKPGDVVEVKLDGAGVLRNVVGNW